MNRIVSSSLLTLFAGLVEPAPRETAMTWLSENEPYLTRVATDLWERAEPAHEEVLTSAYLQSELRRAGFEIEREVAGLPTAFVATYGSSRPIIGVVALLDALPGLGHGCGHNLIGAADLGAVLAVREALARHSLEGTIRFYGAPAEEIYHGGVYMVREGVFDDLDALLFWHPSAVTTVIGRSGLAMDSVRFVFHGRASDATDAAERGRNALHAVEALSLSVDSARIRWPPNAVVNRVLLEGGTIPSVVPERATAWYFLHARDRVQVDAIRAEVASLADGAAEKTGTSVDVQILSSTRDWLVNRTLAELLQKNLEADEGVLPLSFGDEPIPISDDTADASWVTPRGGFLVAAFPAGAPSHTREWAESAAGSFALKGMMRASRTLARTFLDLIEDEDLLLLVRREFERATAGKPYESPLPEGRGPFDHMPRPRH
jgi:aminobenzoyl-glutamate utilization protein B